MSRSQQERYEFDITKDVEKMVFVGDIRMRCPICGDMVLLSQVGFRQMGNGEVRNQPRCAQCRKLKGAERADAQRPFTFDVFFTSMQRTGGLPSTPVPGSVWNDRENRLEVTVESMRHLYDIAHACDADVRLRFNDEGPDLSILEIQDEGQLEEES